MDRLSNIIKDIVDNRGKNPPYYKETGIPVIDTYLISDSQYPNINNANRFIDEYLYENFIRCKNKKDDLLTTLVGNGCGNSCLCGENQVIIQNAVGLRFKDGISQLYMYYYFKQKEIKQWIQNLDRGSAQPNVKVGDLKRMKLDLPSFPKQERISSILNNYDQLIENNNKRIKILEDMAESLYKEWFVRFRFPGYENVKFTDSFPSNFSLHRIDDICFLYRGKGYSSDDIINGDMTLLSMNNIRPYGGFVRDFSRPYCGTYKDYHVLNDGDLIMCITDMTQERRVIGYTGLVSACDKKMIACTHLIKLQTKGIDSLFLYSMFTYSNLSKEISMRATGTNVLGLTADTIKKVKVLIPTQELIDQYVKKVKPVFNLINKIQLSNENLVKERDALLPRLMSGNLEVK